MEARNEVHIVLHENGHINSVDCWCEPTGYWYTNRLDITMFVVEHNDDVPNHHEDVLDERDVHPDWVTKRLDEMCPDQ